MSCADHVTVNTVLQRSGHAEGNKYKQLPTLIPNAPSNAALDNNRHVLKILLTDIAAIDENRDHGNEKLAGAKTRTETPRNAGRHYPPMPGGVMAVNENHARR